MTGKYWIQYAITELKTSGLTVFQYGSCNVVSKDIVGEQLIQLKINGISCIKTRFVLTDENY